MSDTSDLGSTNGTFDENGRYRPPPVAEAEPSDMSLDATISATSADLDEGHFVKGTVVKIDKDKVLVDVGYKALGVIPSCELSIHVDVNPSEVVSLGEELEALVLTKEDKEGRLVLSKKRAQYERVWGTIEAIKEREGVVKGPVIEVVKGGLIIDIGLRGFLPASLVELRRVRDLLPYVGRELEAHIIELDKNRMNCVLSRRSVLEAAERDSRDDGEKAFQSQVHTGAILNGFVDGIAGFGVFVDLGIVKALLHESSFRFNQPSLKRASPCE